MYCTLYITYLTLQKETYENTSVHNYEDLWKKNSIWEH